MGAATPFQFFVDFESDKELQQAVREGRAREFTHFGAFAAGVPDPAAIETVQASTLDWTQLSQGAHASILTETRELLRLRRATIIPLMHSGFNDAAFERHGAAGLTVEWRFNRWNDLSCRQFRRSLSR